MRKKLLLLSAGLILASCGGGGGGGSGSGGSTGGSQQTNYYAVINSFSVTPSTIPRGQSFTVEASFDYQSANGVAYVKLTARDASSSQKAFTWGFYCGLSSYGCIKDFTLNCSYYTLNGQDTVECTMPDGSQGHAVVPPGTYTFTLSVQSWAVLEVKEDTKSVTVVFQ